MMGPSIPPAEAAGAYALIALISDPKAAKERLDKLLAAQKETEQENERLRSSQKDTAKAASDAQHATKEANRKLAFLADRERAVMQREDAVALKEAQLAQDQRDFNKLSDEQVKQHAANQAEHAQHMRAVQEERAVVSRMAHDLQQKQQVVDAKWAKLREIQTAGE